jgi:hypothetical protein
VEQTARAAAALSDALRFAAGLAPQLEAAAVIAEMNDPTSIPRGESLTNREIAQTLFVTARTVEGHLTSVFRKLQLDSRTKLASALGAHAAVSI